MLAAFLRCLGGYVVACIAAGLVQVAFVLPPHDIAFAGWDRLTAGGSWLVFATLQSCLFGAPFALGAIIVAERRRLKSWIAYAAAGFGIALLGFMVQTSGHGFAQPLAVVLYELLAFSSAGLSAGLVYWLAAGRRAGSYSF